MGQWVTLPTGFDFLSTAPGVPKRIVFELVLFTLYINHICKLYVDCLIITHAFFSPTIKGEMFIRKR